MQTTITVKTICSWQNAEKWFKFFQFNFLELKAFPVGSHTSINTKPFIAIVLMASVRILFFCKISFSSSQDLTFPADGMKTEAENIEKNKFCVLQFYALSYFLLLLPSISFRIRLSCVASRRHATSSWRRRSKSFSRAICQFWVALSSASSRSR